MKKNAQQIIDELNNLSIVSYLKILGFTPAAESNSSTSFLVYPAQPGTVTIIVEHDSNTFLDTKSSRTGKLVDLTCHIFQIKPRELIRNIANYRIDLLMTRTISQANQRA